MNKPIASLTLRKYEKPFLFQGRELVQKMCLSLGLLQPNETRDCMVDVVIALIGKELTHKEISECVRDIRKKQNISAKVSDSNIRRQVRRLRDINFVEKNKKGYSFKGALHSVFSEHIEKVYLPSVVERVKEYCEAVEGVYGKNMSKVQESDGQSRNDN